MEAFSAVEKAAHMRVGVDATSVDDAAPFDCWREAMPVALVCETAEHLEYVF